jgi:hypothetical protein
MIVACDGAQHRLALHDGRIELLDHPELEAELALVAFGGAEPACLTRYHLWNDAVADGGFLAEWVDGIRLTPSWFSWLAMALERMRSEGFHEFLRGLPPARARRMGEFLHHFPLPWIDRAAAEVSRAVFGDPASGVVCDDAPGLLLEAVSNRVRRAFVDGVGGRHLSVGAAALVPLTITASPGASPAVEGRLSGPGRGVRIVVDGSWLHRVWIEGAAVIDGHLTLGLSIAEPVTADLVEWGAGSDGLVLRPTVTRRPVRLVDGVWRVSADLL